MKIHPEINKIILLTTIVAETILSSCSEFKNSTYKIDDKEIKINNYSWFNEKYYIHEKTTNGDEITYTIKGPRENPTILKEVEVNSKRPKKEYASKALELGQKRLDYLLKKIDSIDNSEELKEKNKYLNTLRSVIKR